jgi:hypothetical protein
MCFVQVQAVWLTHWVCHASLVQSGGSGCMRSCSLLYHCSVLGEMVRM